MRKISVKRMEKRLEKQQNKKFGRKGFSASFKPFSKLTPLNTAPKKPKKESKKTGRRTSPLLLISSFLLFPQKKMSSLPTPFFTRTNQSTVLTTINTHHSIDKNRGV
jgi:hypothetical protein